jgi:hypothetical protein
MEMIVDALREIAAGTKTVEDIEAIYERIMNSPDAPKVMDLLGLSRAEWTAFGQGVWFDELARWRSSGWPTRCAECGGPIVPAKFGWLARDRDPDHELVHVECPETTGE